MVKDIKLNFKLLIGSILITASLFLLLSIWFPLPDNKKLIAGVIYFIIGSILIHYGVIDGKE